MKAVLTESLSDHFFVVVCPPAGLPAFLEPLQHDLLCQGEEKDIGRQANLCEETERLSRDSGSCKLGDSRPRQTSLLDPSSVESHPPKSGPVHPPIPPRRGVACLRHP